MIDLWLRRRFGDVRMASDGDDMRVNCPFCAARVGREDTKFHLYVNLYRSVGHCFRCSWAGNYVGLIMSVDGCSYPEALHEIQLPTPNVADFDNVYSPRGLVKGEVTSAEPDGYIPLATTIMSKHIGQEEKAVWNYLRSRKVPRQIVKDSFGWVPKSHRVWMLIDKEWWQGRLILVGEPKYISPPWPRGDSLWNAKAMDNHKDIDVCEGVFSAIAVGDTAIALCGKTMTELQAKRIIASAPASVRLMLDADANSDAHSMAELLVRLGYAGDLLIHEMISGDPAEGVHGTEFSWNWETMVTSRL